MRFPLKLPSLATLLQTRYASSFHLRPIIMLTKQYLTQKLAYGLAFSESQAYDFCFMEKQICILTELLPVISCNLLKQNSTPHSAPQTIFEL